MLLNNEIDTYDEDLENEIENWNCEDLHKAIITNFKDYDVKSLKLHLHDQTLIGFLLQLPSICTFKFIKFIDTNIPGMSFHFVMEARMQYKDADSVKQIENLLFLFRVSYYLVCFPEKQIVSVSRARLCRGLLLEFVNTNFFLDFQTKMHAVNNNLSIDYIEKKQIKKNLYLKYFQLYIEKMKDQVFLHAE